MPGGPRLSRCSCRGVLGFYWWGEPLQPTLSAEDAAALAFANIMKPAGRIWTIYSWSMVKAEFLDRLGEAQLGRLVPVDHVKDIVRGDPADLFEIRWQFDVLSGRPIGDPVEETIHIRLYHSEPGRHQTCFVGLHIHQKAIVLGDDLRTRDLQNIEIDRAIDRHDDGDPVDWGIV